MFWVISIMPWHAIRNMLCAIEVFLKKMSVDFLKDFEVW